MRSDLWRVIHAERAALVDDLVGLDPAQWATASLCDGWDVHDVVAHLAATATLSLLGFAKEFLLARFNSGRMVDKQVAAGRRCKPPEILSALRSAISSTASPPQPTITRIIEIIVHGKDIRLPLHISHDYSTIHIAEALDYIGTGQIVEGPAAPLLLAASGRSVTLPDLSGPGVQTLIERLRPITPP